MGRAPPHLKNHFGAITFERESKRAAIASDSAPNGPEDVAIGPLAQARSKIIAPEKIESAQHALHYRGPCTPTRILGGRGLFEVGRAPLRFKKCFGAIIFERYSKRAAIASDSAPNGPEDAAIGPLAQARSKIIAPGNF